MKLMSAMSRPELESEIMKLADLCADQMNRFGELTEQLAATEQVLTDTEAERDEYQALLLVQAATAREATTTIDGATALIRSMTDERGQLLAELDARQRIIDELRTEQHRAAGPRSAVTSLLAGGLGGTR